VPDDRQRAAGGGRHWHCAAIAPPGRDEALNGIAFAEPSGTFYLTGKRWRYLFEVEIPS